MSTYVNPTAQTTIPAGKDQEQSNVGGGVRSSVTTATQVVSAAPALPSSYQLAVSPPSSVAQTYEMIPHRIFVGGFPSGTQESELRAFFEDYGQIREVKVIRNVDGGCRGYGFVTFEDEEEAQKIRQRFSCETVEFKGRKLNVGPAMRKMMQVTRVNDLAVVTPNHLALQLQQLQMQGAYTPQPNAYYMQPTADPYQSHALQAPALYTVLVPGGTAGPAYTTAYPSCAYSPAQTPSNPPAAIPMYQQCQQQTTVCGQSTVTPDSRNSPRNTPDKSPKPDRSSPKDHPSTPLRPPGVGGSSKMTRQAAQTAANAAVPPPPQTAQQQQWTTTATPQQQYSTGWDQQPPLTPITPGIQTARFGWAPTGSNMGYQTAYSTPIYGQQTAQQSNAGQTTAWYPGQNACYPITDMTHYSQMFTTASQLPPP